MEVIPILYFWIEKCCFMSIYCNDVMMICLTYLFNFISSFCLGDKYVNGEIIPCKYPTYQPKQRSGSKYESRRYERRRDGPPPEKKKPRQEATTTDSASAWGSGIHTLVFSFLFSVFLFLFQISLLDEVSELTCPWKIILCVFRYCDWIVSVYLPPFNLDLSWLWCGTE